MLIFLPIICYAAVLCLCSLCYAIFFMLMYVYQLSISSIHNKLIYVYMHVIMIIKVVARYCI